MKRMIKYLCEYEVEVVAYDKNNKEKLLEWHGKERKWFSAEELSKTPLKFNILGAVEV